MVIRTAQLNHVDPLEDR